MTLNDKQQNELNQLLVKFNSTNKFKIDTTLIDELPNMPQSKVKLIAWQSIIMNQVLNDLLLVLLFDKDKTLDLLIDINKSDILPSNEIALLWGKVSHCKLLIDSLIVSYSTLTGMSYQECLTIALNSTLGLDQQKFTNKLMRIEEALNDV